jgi:hypothetical protein
VISWFSRRVTFNTQSKWELKRGCAPLYISSPLGKGIKEMGLHYRISSGDVEKGNNQVITLPEGWEEV